MPLLCLFEVLFPVLRHSKCSMAVFMRFHFGKCVCECALIPPNTQQCSPRVLPRDVLWSSSLPPSCWGSEEPVSWEKRVFNERCVFCQQWFNLKDVPSGSVHLRLEWLSLLSSANILSEVSLGTPLKLIFFSGQVRDLCGDVDKISQNTRDHWGCLVRAQTGQPERPVTA